MDTSTINKGKGRAQVNSTEKKKNCGYCTKNGGNYAHTHEEKDCFKKKAAESQNSTQQKTQSKPSQSGNYASGSGQQNKPTYQKQSTPYQKRTVKSSRKTRTERARLLEALAVLDEEEAYLSDNNTPADIKTLSARIDEYPESIQSQERMASSELDENEEIAVAGSKGKTRRRRSTRKTTMDFL
jgi:hypothetical protein